MTTFALVHGANHGAFCWDFLTPQLLALGHQCIVVNLPCDDPAAGVAVYAEHVATALGDANDVTLVGHSLGGLTIPVVATHRPVRRLVYLCAALPLPGSSFFEQPGSEQHAAEAPFVPIVHDDGTMSVPEQAAVDTFFHDCAPEVQAWAVARLRRQGLLPLLEETPLARLPEGAKSGAIPLHEFAGTGSCGGVIQCVDKRCPWPRWLVPWPRWSPPEPRA